MGASAQQILQSDPEYLRRQLAAQEQQRVNPTGSAAGALGALLGRGLSNVSQGKGFFQAPDYGLQRVSGVQGIMKSVQFDPNNPAEYYNQVGRALQEAGYADLAPMAFTEARKMQVQERELGARERGVTIQEEQLLLQQIDKDPYGAIERAVKLPKDDPQRAIILAGAGAKIGERATANYLKEVQIKEAEAKTRLAEVQTNQVGKGKPSETVVTKDGFALTVRGEKYYTPDPKTGKLVEYQGEIKKLSSTPDLLSRLEGMGTKGTLKTGQTGLTVPTLTQAEVDARLRGEPSASSPTSLEPLQRPEGSVSPRPPDSFGGTKNPKAAEWDRLYGATHNRNGAPKAMYSPN